LVLSRTIRTDLYTEQPDMHISPNYS
jgi:hypothetical protein